MRKALLASFGLWLVISAGVQGAVVLHVPSEYPTIQAGIDAAADGDTVLIADGTYTGGGNKNIDFGGRAITVRSENGPENCIIDCEHSGRGFYFNSNEDANSVLDGLTIKNGRQMAQMGYNAYGGGIFIKESNPVIANCFITENITTRNGGGVYITDCSDNPMLINPGFPK